MFTHPQAIAPDALQVLSHVEQTGFPRDRIPFGVDQTGFGLGQSLLEGVDLSQKSVVNFVPRILVVCDAG